MPDLNSKLDRFTAAILAETTAETEHTLTELNEKRAAAYACAEERLLGEVYRYIHGEVGRIKSESGRQVSRHMLDCKRSLYLRREEMSREVFSAVVEKLAGYTAGPDYARRMEALFRDALRALEGAGEVRLFLRPADMSMAPALAAVAPGVTVTPGPGSFTLGGLIADAPGLGRRVDATFDSSIEALSGHFAELFGLSLSNELDEEVETHE